ncbi:hypothetical protein TPSea814_000823a [Treponema pallidum subsp. pallidum str. Sea 81-4]|nr:hypothetical protein TPChic_0823a [Treponema pallidum subsp. pallidum str. Chicago]AHN67476.1 hypothetical protein TPSea814_000823a [Treponema pallidum subsp. pallidum str. Sea 81-4]WPQ91809.1 hypothetical protein SOJ22_04225 [Treponema pallidum]
MTKTPHVEQKAHGPRLPVLVPILAKLLLALVGCYLLLFSFLSAGHVETPQESKLAGA